MKQKAHFLFNEEINTDATLNKIYCFKENENRPSKHKELDDFEKVLNNKGRNIKFHKQFDAFQKSNKGDITKINKRIYQRGKNLKELNPPKTQTTQGKRN